MRNTHDATPHALSDFWSPQRLHASGLYAEVFEPLALEDQLSVYADPGRPGVLGVSGWDGVVVGDGGCFLRVQESLM